MTGTTTMTHLQASVSCVISQYSAKVSLLSISVLGADCYTWGVRFPCSGACWQYWALSVLRNEPPTHWLLAGWPNEPTNLPSQTILTSLFLFWLIPCNAQWMENAIFTTKMEKMEEVGMLTLSCFILAWMSHSEKCSMLVSWRSISVNHTSILSLAVSNSSLWQIKCCTNRKDKETFELKSCIHLLPLTCHFPPPIINDQIGYESVT